MSKTNYKTFRGVYCSILFDTPPLPIDILPQNCARSAQHFGNKMCLYSTYNFVIVIILCFYDVNHWQNYR